MLGGSMEVAMSTGVGPKPSIKKEEFEDEYTPITNFADIGRALGVIKTQLPVMSERISALTHVVNEDIKPKVNTVHDGFIELRTKAKGTDTRLKALEGRTERPHDCFQTELLDELKRTQAEQRQACSEARTTMAQVKTHQEVEEAAIKKLDGRWSKVIGGAVSILVIVLGVAAGWLVTLTTVQADVGHLATEQTKMQGSIETFRDQNEKMNEKMIQQINDVKRTVTTANAPEPGDVTIRDLCSKMSPDERRQMRKALGPEIGRQCL